MPASTLLLESGLLPEPGSAVQLFMCVGDQRTSTLLAKLSPQPLKFCLFSKSEMSDLPLSGLILYKLGLTSRSIYVSMYGYVHV